MLNQISGDTRIFEVTSLKGETGAILIDYYFYNRNICLGIGIMTQLKAAAQLTNQPLETILKALNDLPDIKK